MVDLEENPAQIGDAQLGRVHDAPIVAEKSERELAEEAGARLTVDGRVEYTGNGSTGVLVQMGLPHGDLGPVLSLVLLDGRPQPSLIKTKYLVPSYTTASVPEELHPLDALEQSLPHEDLMDGSKLPGIMRAIALAQIFAAREAERQGDILQRIANHFGVK